MADGDGGVSPRCLLEQYIGDRLAHDVAPADNDHLGALNLGAGTDKQLLDASRGAGHIVRLAYHQLAHVHRVEAVNILLGVDGVEDFLLVEVLGQRQLDQDAVNLGVLIELCQLRR